MTIPLQISHVNAMVEEIENYAILMLDPTGIILNWNRGAQKIKGYAADEIIGKYFGIFYLPDDRDSGLPGFLLRQAREKGKTEHVGWRVKKDGTTFWGAILITALHNAEGSIIGFTKVTHDLTTQKMLEESRQAYLTELEQHSQEMEQLTYITSHDLQEPLRTIKGIINLLEEKKGIWEDEENKMMIGFISNSVDRMHRLVKAILEYSLLGNSKELCMVDCNELVKDLVTDLAGVIGNKGAVVQYSELPVLKGYTVELRQLFQNLLTNAIKFSRAGVAPVVSIYAEREGDRYWRFSVSDNGIGIAAKYLAKIFLLFQRLHLPEEYEGTGIGLAYAKKIVELHGGKMNVTSEPGKGSVFSFTIADAL